MESAKEKVCVWNIICVKNTTFAVSFYLRILPSASVHRRFQPSVRDLLYMEAEKGNFFTFPHCGAVLPQRNEHLQRGASLRSSPPQRSEESTERNTYFDNRTLTLMLWMLDNYYQASILNQ